MSITFDMLLKHWVWIGGTRWSLAKRLGVDYTLTYYWVKKRGGQIPPRYHREVMMIMGQKSLQVEIKPYSIAA